AGPEAAEERPEEVVSPVEGARVEDREPESRVDGEEGAERGRADASPERADERRREREDRDPERLPARACAVRALEAEPVPGDDRGREDVEEDRPTHGRLPRPGAGRGRRRGRRRAGRPRPGRRPPGGGAE